MSGSTPLTITTIGVSRKFHGSQKFVDTRKLAIKPAVQIVLTHPGVAGFIKLNTCMRQELHVRHNKDMIDANELATLWFGEDNDAYKLSDQAAFTHVFRTASGIDSVPLGNVAIQTQMRVAANSGTDSELTRLFRSAVMLGTVLNPQVSYPTISDGQPLETILYETHLRTINRHLRRENLSAFTPLIDAAAYGAFEEYLLSQSSRKARKHIIMLCKDSGCDIKQMSEYLNSMSSSTTLYSILKKIIKDT
jgi:hypothetical protein